MNFVKVDQRDGAGRFVFPVEMTDSLAKYDIALLASFSCDGKTFSELNTFELSLLWESPDSLSYVSELSLAGSSAESSSYYGRAVKAVVGKGLVPRKAGEWKLYIAADEDSLKRYGLSGIGLSVEGRREKER